MIGDHVCVYVCVQLIHMVLLCYCLLHCGHVISVVCDHLICVSTVLNGILSSSFYDHVKNCIILCFTCFYHVTHILLHEVCATPKVIFRPFAKYRRGDIVQLC